MCRLLGYAAASDRSPAAAVGDVQMSAFCAMARLHDDGWGAAWTHGAGSGVAVERSPRTGYHDPALHALTTGATARAGLLHLRLASSGMPVQDRNTHPFLGELHGTSVALAHNGAIKPVVRLEALLPDEAWAGVHGDTDSERYAALIRHRAAELGDLAAGAAAVAGQLTPLFPASSLNAILLTERELVVVHASDGARIPHDDFDSSGLAEDELPIGHRSGYYQLWRRRSADGTVVFSSSGLRTDGWEPLPPATVVAVDLETLTERVLPIVAEAFPEHSGTGARIPAPSSPHDERLSHDSHTSTEGVKVGG